MPEDKKSNEVLLTEISQKLDKIIGILAIRGKDEDTQIRILKKIGFEAVEIGNLLGVQGRLRNKKAWKEK